MAAHTKAATCIVMIKCTTVAMLTTTATCATAATRPSATVHHAHHGNRMRHIDAHPRPPTNKKPASPTHERARDGPS